jgi:hypothetical protein
MPAAVAHDISYGIELEIKKQAVWSPNGRRKIETVPYLQRFHDFRRSHLFLIQNGKRMPVKLDQTSGYDHFVQVLWSPSSRFFAVNLWDPGRTACSYLYDVNHPSNRIDIESRLKSLIKDKYQKGFFEGCTIMGPKIVATRWLNSSWIEIHLEDGKEPVSRGAPPKEYSLTYRWNLKDKLILEPEKGKEKTCFVPACDDR